MKRLRPSGLWDENLGASLLPGGIILLSETIFDGVFSEGWEFDCSTGFEFDDSGVLIESAAAFNSV
jgi:hypothetical protein